MHRKPRSAIPLAAAGLAVFAVTTGCDVPSSYSSAAGQNGMATMGTTDTGPALTAVRAFDLGPVVVDGGGYVVYRYDRDTTNPSKSTCTGTCAQQWKPVPASATQHITGLDQSLVGTLTRDDGTDQATLNGWPLYRYTKDQMPGETAGQGMGGVWFPVTPQGGKVQTAADPGRSDAFGL
ncbi:putative lipoprotein with Yx(FWY)xxD motif [Amycolatopsis bartoniae]|uniref:Lipoprotein with Yx(FWY)xxD motif n=1 Tax=Amycolatopsis bartoniae TaxID=941986 RepID=A0A8H9MCT4_9PSEU|nr:hypothetical protein [Amycolatopsis bartoniae]MBB2939078.1 putative lipoprotein with Yx(FWY)xxD motif [Amycolatopsis bartoniae]TVT06336.1 hypothetical protein FNH07_20520 [Amycolatopsis bartoniae]GHF65087.1 hypothetical protein GCM10017566_43270 [Amycolatopsis bartoniae]